MMDGWKYLDQNKQRYFKIAVHLLISKFHLNMRRGAALVRKNHDSKHAFRENVFFFFFYLHASRLANPITICHTSV